MKRYLVSLFSFFIVSSCYALETETSLRKEYKELNKSILGGSLIISCGASKFKIESGLSKSPILYWKEELTWKKIEKVKFFDEGFEFQGLSIKGGVPLENLEFSPDLPIFKDKINYIDSRSPISYFYVEPSETYNTYIISLDFLTENIKYKNSEPILNSIGFKSEQYVNEQLGERPTLIKSELFSNADQVKAYEKRKSLIDKYIKIYTEKYLVIEAKPFSYEFSRNCEVN